MICLPKRLLNADGSCRLLVAAFTAATVFAAFDSQHAIAQKGPELGYAYPPAVSIGKTTHVALGGFDLTADMEFFLHHASAKLTTDGQPGEFLVPPPPYWFGEKGRLNAFPIPREVSATIQVGETTPGFAYWQVANANGVSKTAPLYVSDVPELLEDRWRNEPQVVATLSPGEGLGLSGRLSRIAETDAYEFSVAQPVLVTIDLMARRLGADFHGIMSVQDSSGKTLAEAADTEGNDTYVSFPAEPDEKYTLRLHDVDYRGNRAMIYRLGITAAPHVTCWVPAAMAAGESRAVSFRGPVFDRIVRQVDIPASAAGQTHWPYSLETPFGTTVVKIPLLEAPETPSDANAMTAPCALTVDMSAIKQASSSRRRFKVQFSPGNWSIAAVSSTIGGSLDPGLEIFDLNGKRVAQNDDGDNTDAELSLNVATASVYDVVIDDLSGRVGERDAVCQLRIQPQPVGFTLAAPQQLSAPLGGSAAVKVQVQRFGYDGEISLHVSGLPDGVSAPEQVVVPAKKNTGSIALTVAEDAPVSAALLEIYGVGIIDEQERRVQAQATADGNLTRCVPDALSKVLFAGTLKPRYKVLLTDKNRQRAVHRGTTYPAPFVIEREEGFNGEVRLQMASKQGRHRQGITGPAIVVPPTQSSALFPCNMPEWLETDRTTRMVVLGVAQQPDPQGNLRSVTQMADARITMILEGALLRISEANREIRREHTCNLGEDLTLQFQLSRSKKLPLPVVVELVPPAEISEWLEADPVELAPTTSNGSLTIRTRTSPRLAGEWPLVIRATSMLDGQWPVTSQHTINVTFQ